MADLRFYRSLGPVTARELAELTGSELRGDGDQPITDAAPVDTAGVEELTFLTDPRLADVLHAQRPAACVVAADLAPRAEGACRVLLINDNPRLAMAQIAARLWAPVEPESGAPVSPDAEIADDARIGPGAVVAQGAYIGAGAVIGPGAYLGPSVRIGAGSRVGAGARIEFATVGEGSDIGANCAIGGAGFGVAAGKGAPVAIPHIGKVWIGDDVRIGALCAIDRGMFHDTVIEDHVKMDNLCHVAHNCRIGRGTVIAALAGISGSTTIGEGVTMGGRVGVSDHVEIGDGAQIGADSAVMENVPAGARWKGAPAKPIRAYFRELAWLKRLAAQRGGAGGEDR